MPHTFDIRFARSAGLAAILEAPGNAFRWKGDGLLSIDAQGISIAVRRGLSTLFARALSRRITATQLTEVYREGDALRLEFSTQETARAVLPFWVSDRKVAAEIVKLLPTLRTVELEDSTSGTAREYRFDWRLVAGLFACVLAVSLGALALQRFLAPSAVQVPAMEVATPGAESDATTAAPGKPVSSAPTELPAADVAPSTLPPRERVREIVEPVYLDPPALAPSSTNAPDEITPVVPDASTPMVTPQDTAIPTIVWRVRVSEDGVVPIVPGMAAYDVARRQLDLFLSESQRAQGVSSWWDVTVRIHTSPEFNDPALWALRDIELAASRAWRNYLSNYGGSGPGDERAQAERDFAQMLTDRARQYVR